MIILNQMIRVGRFAEFVREVLKIRNQEKLDKLRWEFWLHRIYDMPFDEYVAKLDGTETNEAIPDDVLEATVQDSMGIINGFCPS